MFEAFDIGGHRALALAGPAAPPAGGFTVSFTGDFGFWNRAPDPEALARQLEGERELLARFDLRVINLEFILPGPGGRPVDRACERASLDYLRGAGFHVASLANNHALAFGDAGLRHNVERLEEAGLAVIGLADRKLLRFEGAGLVLGLFSLTDLLDDPDPARRVLRSRAADIDRLRAELAGADYRIGFPHLGSRSVYPGLRELKQARALLAAGADLLVCTGSHFPKGFVELDGRPVCFGLGNHLFGWEGGGTEPVGMHLAANFADGALRQLFALPFCNTILSGGAGPLRGEAFEDFARELSDRSTVDPSRFFADPRTRAGAVERLKGLRWRDLGKVRWRHVSYGLRALLAKAFRR